MVATRFYPGAQESLATLPSRPFGLNERRHSNCKPLCLCSLPESRDSVRRPFVGLDGRNRRDGVTYTEKKFSDQDSECFIFSEIDLFELDARKLRVFREVLKGKTKTAWRNSFSGESFARVCVLVGTGCGFFV